MERMSRNRTLSFEFMLLRWCPGQGSNLHDGITRRGILSREIAANCNNRQIPPAYGSMGYLLCIAVDFRCLLRRLCQKCAAKHLRKCSTGMAASIINPDY